MVKFRWFSYKSTSEVVNESYHVVELPKMTKEKAMDMCIAMWTDYIKGKYPSDIPIIHVKVLKK